MRIVAELTKAFAGSHEDILEQIQALAAEQKVDDRDVHIVARADQLAAKPRFSPEWNWREGGSEGLQANLAVRRVLAQIGTSNDSSEIILLSYDGTVLRIANEPAGQQASRITAMPLSTLRSQRTPAGAGRLAGSTGNEPRWTFDAVIELPVALDLLQNALVVRRTRLCNYSSVNRVLVGSGYGVALGR